MMTVFAYIYYFVLPLAAAWCVISYLKVYPRPGHLRRWINNRITDTRPWRVKCKRFRTDGPTPCYCCKGRCYAASDGKA